MKGPLKLDEVMRLDDPGKDLAIAALDRIIDSLIATGLSEEAACLWVAEACSLCVDPEAMVREMNKILAACKGASLCPTSH